MNKEFKIDTTQLVSIAEFKEILNISDSVFSNWRHRDKRVQVKRIGKIDYVDLNNIDLPVMYEGILQSEKDKSKDERRIIVIENILTNAYNYPF